MAEKKKKVLHIRSNVSTPKQINIERTTLNVNVPKVPTSDNINYGEIAINFGDGHEGMFIKNSSNDIVQLNTVENIRYDGKIDESLRTYLDERYVKRSGDMIYGDVIISASDGYDDNPKFKYDGTEFIINSDEVKINGTVVSDGSVYSSDKKLKKDIKKISEDDVESVSKIDFKSYKFIGDKNERNRYGVIAQDLEKVGLDNLVVETDGKKGVDYVSLLILKIEELERRIKDLENK